MEQNREYYLGRQANRDTPTVDGRKRKRNPHLRWQTINMTKVEDWERGWCDAMRADCPCCRAVKIKTAPAP